jgi:hypothetical protein
MGVIQQEHEENEENELKTVVCLITRAYPENRAISIIGPPIPHPTSKTFIPGLRPSLSAKKCSCLAIDASTSSPFK